MEGSGWSSVPFTPRPLCPFTPKVCERSELSSLRASSAAAWSKYRIVAVVNGRQNLAIHSCHLASPMTARRLMSAKCLLSSLMSAHNAPGSQP